MDVKNLTQKLLRFDITENYPELINIIKNKLGEKFTYNHIHYKGDDVGFIASRGSSNKLCFVAHLEINDLFDRKKWNYDPFAGDVVDGVLYGRGINCMKGAISALLYAISETDRDISLIILKSKSHDIVNSAIEYIKYINFKPKSIVLLEPSSDASVTDSMQVGYYGVSNIDINISCESTYFHDYDGKNLFSPMLDISNILINHKFDSSDVYLEETKIKMLSCSSEVISNNSLPIEVKAKFVGLRNENCSHKDIIEVVEYAIKMLSSNSKIKSHYENICDAFISNNLFSYMGIKNSYHGESFLYHHFSRLSQDIISLGLYKNSSHGNDESIRVDELIDMSNVYRKLILGYDFS
jgi:acetylornithine deacetylase/succinyl-diaminopimelate desuccinylase-like protein